MQTTNIVPTDGIEGISPQQARRLLDRAAMQQGDDTTITNQTVYPIAVDYTHTTITLPPEPSAEYTDYAPYDPAQHTYDMMLAGDTGLAYIIESINSELSYTIVHLPSARFLNIGWFVETEALAQRWISWLLELADWTEAQPHIKHDRLFDALALICAGMLVDPELDADPLTFDPVEQLQFGVSNVA
jgi:hypothetical protein